MTILRILYLFGFALLAGCVLKLAGAQSESLPPTPTVVIYIPQTTLVPTLNRQIRPLSSPAPQPIPTAAVCVSDQILTRYTIHAMIDYPKHTVIVQQRLDYINHMRDDLTQIVLNVKPNTLPGIFDLAALKMGDQELGYKLAGQRLTVNLAQPLKPGCSLSLNLSFHLKIPEMDQSGANAYRGYLGYSPRQTNLGHWLPVVAVRRGADWITHDLSPIGEQEVLDEADWDVTIESEGASDQLRIVAPGEVKENGPKRWHFLNTAARDFAVSMSESFTVAAQKTSSGIKVELYTFSDARIPNGDSTIDSAAFALDSATHALTTYEGIYGRYPHPRLAVVQGDFPDGMEFSGIVFVGGEYFRGFNGPTSYLMVITVHEIAHQWWYARVGNDQALNPWLDEALATYSELVFIEQNYPNLRDWWWSFRVDHFSPQGFVDSDVYQFKTRREYINAVYLRGVRMLDDLRGDLGSAAFFAWIRRYADVGAGRVVEPDFFWSLLSPDQLTATAKTREKYLHSPQIIVLPPDSISKP
jgi:hypothetical protein